MSAVRHEGQPPLTSPCPSLLKRARSLSFSKPCLSAVREPPNKCARTAPSAVPTATATCPSLRAGTDAFPRYKLPLSCLDSLLPTHDGLLLLKSYADSVIWAYNPIPLVLLHETLEEADRHGATAIHPHRMACLLAALALGTLFLNHSALMCPSTLAELGLEAGRRCSEWLDAAITCLTASPNVSVLVHPTPDACSALHLMVTYMMNSGNGRLVSGAKSALGLGLRAVRSIAFPCTPHEANPTEDIGPRILWDLLDYDRTLALSFGQPRIACLAANADQPATTSRLDNDRSSCHSVAYHNFNHGFTGIAEEVLAVAGSTDGPTPSAVQLLDRRIREYELRAPRYLLLRHPLPTELVMDMNEAELDQLIRQRHMVCLVLHRSLLHLHRFSFLRILHSRDSIADCQGQMKASFAAVMASSTWMTAMFASLIHTCPVASMWWEFTYQALSAALIQTYALLYMPRHELWTRTMDAFQTNCRTFNRAAAHSRLAARSVPLLAKLRLLLMGATDEAEQRSTDAVGGSTPSMPASRASSPSSTSGWTSSSARSPSLTASSLESNSAVTPPPDSETTHFLSAASNALLSSDEMAAKTGDAVPASTPRGASRYCSPKTLCTALWNSAGCNKPAAALLRTSLGPIVDGLASTDDTCTAPPPAAPPLCDAARAATQHPPTQLPDTPTDDLLALVTARTLPAQHHDHAAPPAAPTADLLRQCILFWHPGNVARV